MTTSRTNDVDRHKPAQHYEALRELGDCYASLGNYGQAQRCYEKAACLGPDEPGPYVGLGVAAMQKDKLDDAEIAFRVACRLDPSCAKAYAGLAMVAQQRRDFPQAFDLYMKSLELDTDSITALLGMFQVSCEMGSFARIIYYLDVYLRMHPGDTAVMFALAALYLKDGQAGRSKVMLLDILARDPANRDAANLLEEAEHAGAKGTMNGGHANEASGAMAATEARTTLDQLYRLLQEQLELVHQGRLAAAESLCERTGPLVQAVVAAGVLAGPDGDERRQSLSRVYRELCLVLTAQREEVSASLGAIRRGKQMLRTYRTNAP